MGWPRVALGLVGRSFRDPSIGIDLLRVAWRFRRRHWHRQFPFLPLPARDYVRWRMHTAYGRDDAVPTADEIVRYAQWAARET